MTRVIWRVFFLLNIQNCWYKTISVSGTGTLPPCPSPLFWRKPVWPLTGILNTLAGSWVNCVPLKAPSWSTSGSPICLPNWNLLKLGISRMKSSLLSVSFKNLLVRTLLFYSLKNKSNNLFVTSKNETTNSPIHEFKALLFHSKDFKRHLAAL